jgi:N-methylhydantoinase A/oxoprolinase/acetone carboxylase beta subunit
MLDGDRIYHTKSLTTPFDLSKCFFDGLTKLAREIYGDQSRVDELLQSTDYIRYSTTQGTNALVERKGPRLGLLLLRQEDLAELSATAAANSTLLDSLVGDRVALIETATGGETADMAIVAAVNKVVTAGANRIVLSLNTPDFHGAEAAVQKIVGRRFPSHLLGVVPVLAAGELVDGENFARRTWSALLNAFLHPAMERFLYSADHRLKSYKTRNPLLIYRNDGGAARVAKTTAIKTYSSGPRGGLEGARALARHYGFKRLLSYDVGGTTTDVGLVSEGELATQTYGTAEGVEIGFPLVRIHSTGVGGSSIIELRDGRLRVGPESVGAAPGPACFGLGGKKATITDVFLLLGVLDPNTYFGGELDLDSSRARETIMANIAVPLGLELYPALQQMLSAWVGEVAGALTAFTDIDGDTTLAGFGGGGALAATRVADTVGATRVIIPGMSSVFSAYGISFSPLSQEYRITLKEHSDAALASTLEDCRQRATKDMYAESVDIDDCDIAISLLRERAGSEELFPLARDSRLPCELEAADTAVVLYSVKREIPGQPLGRLTEEQAHAAASHCTRRIMRSETDWLDVPVLRTGDLDPGASASGPLVIEEAFFTGYIDEGWTLTVSGNRDLLLQKR